MKISPSRSAAFDILMRIETEAAFSSILLPMFEDGLSAADRSLCHELTLGTLRRQIYLDRVVAHFAGDKKVDIEVRIALRLGLYQLFYLTRVPPYSSINESVNLVARAKKTSAKGFVNAILRRASREQPVLAFADDIDRISVETSHPRWLIEKWARDMGAAQAAVVAAANNEIATAAFRLIAGPTDEMQRLVETSRPSAYVDDCYVAGKTDETLYDLADKGEIYLQDEASQMVAQTVVLSDGMRFLDVCAAPGGKTGLIARRASATTSMVVAGDLHPARVGALRDNCRRQGADVVSILQYDAVAGLPFADETFDLVMVDAPCSGTGTIRRNPEIRYSLVRDDLPALSAKQLAILEIASKLVRRAGTLIYSTCSLETEENEAVCTRFLAGDTAFESIEPGIPAQFLTAGGFARTWPHRDGMDGFFIAAFRRV